MGSATNFPDVPLSDSVIAVPPLARTADDRVDPAENRKMIRYLEAGGVRTLLYGGNAVMGQVTISEYASLLESLLDSIGVGTRLIPSIGPCYGMMLDQVVTLRDMGFPTAMVLPTLDPTTPVGLASGIRRIVDRYGRPIVLYLKREGTIDVAMVQQMVRDGLISWIKYAIVREQPREDGLLRALVDGVGAKLIVSGMGEQPAIAHWREFGLAGFTSGCVCIAPKQSMQLLDALRRGDYDEAERLRTIFAPLEALRDAMSPVSVLHVAVERAGICRTGPIRPWLSEMGDRQAQAIATAAESLRRAEPD
ncbi:MAG: dihydrodipicolinate synthase family protein [Planctomycetes bacterium]|nr:dihydrodipicolinate synthase family protein [Planctomycetota bacterium]